ncbi:MAG: right-handed parallel beta-helix repeat-containing protein, partial [Candidatus Peribacteraceae bacterium]|nr:right-handed parallel beta-helix repeat-containing protein [Candidatus Peribacteraceae bacterium]
MNDSSPDPTTMNDTSGLGNDGTIVGSFGLNTDYLPLAKYSNECGSCSECNAKIQIATPGTYIYLNQSISNQVGNCIEFDGNDGVTFDCQGFDVGGDWSGTDYGVYLNDSSDGNTVKNCNITGFYNGLNSNSSVGNSIINNSVTTNINYGNAIYLLNTNTSFIENNTMFPLYGNSQGVHVVSSNSNVMNNNTVITTVDNTNGFALATSTNNTITNNTLDTTGANAILVTGGSPFHYNHTITNNTKSGEPIYYYFDEHDTVLLADTDNVAQVLVTYSDNITLRNLTMDMSTIYFAMATNSTVENCNLSTSYYRGYGVQLVYGSYLNNITNNTIASTGNRGYGIHSGGSYYNNISFNTFSTTVTEAIYMVTDLGILYWNNTIENNTQQGEPIYYYFDEHDTVLENTDNVGQVIVAYSDNVTLRNLTMDKNSIFLFSSQNSIVENCDIDINNPYEYGLYLYNTSDSIITNNSISTASTQSYGIYIQGSSRNSIENNNVTTAWDGSHVISLQSSSYYNNITGNIITGSGSNSYGVYLNNIVESTIIKDNNITTENNGPGIIIMTNANYNNVTGNRVKVGYLPYGMPTVLVISAYNNTFHNNLFNTSYSPGNTSVVALDSSENYWNTTKDSSTVNLMGTPYIGGNYWADVYGTGYSETCVDADVDGICDYAYDISSNSPFMISGPVDDAIYFDDVDDYIDCGNDQSLNFSEKNFTISFWVNPYNLTASRMILSKWPGSWVLAELVIHKQTDNTIRVSVANGTDYSATNTTGAMTANQWYHIAVTYNRSVLSIYSDGQLNNSVAPGFSKLSSSSTILTVGGYGTSNYKFGGGISEVRLWNRSLSSTEIANMYDNESAGQYDPNMDKTGLVLELHLNDTDLTTAIDTSGEGNDGTIYGSNPNIDYLPLAKYTGECSYCGECGAMINVATPGTIIKLNQSLMNQGGNCVNFYNSDGVTLDCQGHTIDTDESGNYWGMYMGPNAHNNTIKNCVISDYFNAILLDRANGTTIVNNTITRDNDITYSYGAIMVNTSYHSYIANNTVTSTGTRNYGVNIADGSMYNTLFNNTISTSENNAQAIGVNAGSNSNIFENNTITTTGLVSYGIILAYNTNNTVRFNTLDVEDANSLTLSGDSPDDYNHTIEGNTEEGEPIYYYFNNDSVVLENTDNVGEVFSAYSTNMTFRNLTMDKDAIILALTNDSRIENCNITSNGGYLSPVYFIYDSNSNNVTNNTITSLGPYSHAIWMEADSDSNRIDNNTITASGNVGYGIHVRWGADYNNITNNVISTSSDGVYLYDNTNYNVIENNTIASSLGTGVSFYVCSYNSVINNTIETPEGLAIYVHGTTVTAYHNHTIENNTEYGEPIYYYFNEQNSILLNNTDNVGQVIVAASNNVTVRNLTMDKDGILFANSDNSKVEDCNITTDGTGEIGILMRYSDSNNVTNTTMYLSSTYANGIQLYMSSSNTIAESVVTVPSATAFYINDDSDTNILRNNTITGYQTGVYFSASDYNNVTENRIKTTYMGAAVTSVIYFDDEGNYNNSIYNNVLNVSSNGSGINFETDVYNNYWNTTKTSAVNLLGNPYIGGNYWANTTGGGFSDTCADADVDGLCDGWYTLTSGWDSQGVVDSGYYFDGTNTYADWGVAGSPEITGAITVAFWVKMDDISQSMYMLGRGIPFGNQGDNSSFTLALTGGGLLGFDMYNGTNRDSF